MGTVFKKIVTKPLPLGAEISIRDGQRFARWKNAKGKNRKALITTGINGQDRIVIESSKYYAKYRDGSRIVRTVATGCKDETAARGFLADLERRAELVKAGVMTASEDSIADHLCSPIEMHRHAYLTHLKVKGVSADHHDNVERQLERLTDECKIGTLADFDAGTVERWLAVKAKEGMAGRTRNTYLSALLAFVNWCIDEGRLIVNPFTRIPKADEKTDVRRKRRSMQEWELVTLLDVARRRPLLDALTIRRGERKGQAVANVKDKERERLDWLGRERALIYKTLVLTGLRRGELASFTVAHLYLEASPPYARLDAADEKSREGADIVFRDDLADDFRRWLADKLKRSQDDAQSRGEAIPMQLPADEPLFVVPVELVKILDRDLKFAGIPKVDERGRTLDVHALRHTFGTLLSKGGVTPRTAQEAMRHSDIGLTMNVYTDPKLLDVAGALGTLPALPLHGKQGISTEVAKATGTDDLRHSQFAPGFAPTLDKPSKSQSFPVKMAPMGKGTGEGGGIAVTSTVDKRKEPQSKIDSGSFRAGDRIRTDDVQLGKLAFYH